MGAWGVAAFENDHACDYLLEATTDGLVSLEEAFGVVLEADGYLEAPEGERAVAAAELLVALITGDTSQLPEGDLPDWAEATPTARLEALRAPALAALDRVTAPESELAELWAETESHTAWHQEVEALRARLRDDV